MIYILIKVFFPHNDVRDFTLTNFIIILVFDII